MEGLYPKSFICAKDDEDFVKSFSQGIREEKQIYFSKEISCSSKMTEYEGYCEFSDEENSNLETVLHMISQDRSLRDSLLERLSDSIEEKKEKEREAKEKSLMATMSVAEGILNIIKSFLSSLQKNDPGLPENLRLYSTMDRAGFLVDMSMSSMMSIFTMITSKEYETDVASYPEFERLQQTSTEISENAAKLFSSLKASSLDLYTQSITRSSVRSSCTMGESE